MKIFCNAVQQKGVKIWLDEEELKDDIRGGKEKGISYSSHVLVFITDNYMRKANKQGPKGELDNVFYELSSLDHTKRRVKILPIVLEPRCLDTSKWFGKVATLGSLLSIDFTEDSLLEKASSLLFERLAEKSSYLVTKHRKLLFPPPFGQVKPKFQEKEATASWG